ncbi:site-specific integrase [Bacteroides fragilis]|uniref:site-specific integrase n=1 Tax=Bacteroides fragilis TaxID=817 RepID=UPI001C6FF4C0|nr:site-specific integrase [Bacteroides fragilis]MBW9277651.1 recombinase [Bacteroides fragilis]
MAKTNFYLDTRRPKKNGTFPIKINVRHNGKFLVSTDFNATPNEWTGSEYVRGAENYRAKNIAVRNLKNKVDTFLILLEEKGKLKAISDKKLKEQIESLLKNQAPVEKRFIDYLDDFVATKEKENTIKLYLETKNRITNFDENCTFDTITRKWLEGFDKWMICNNLKVNSRAAHLRNIRAVFNYAIDNDETTLYPFRKFKIAREGTRKRSLSVEQLVTLRDFNCTNQAKEYRDMFMLMVYLIGINGIDLFDAKPPINGRIEYRRKKTGRLYSIKVEPEAMEIINRYAGKRYLINTAEVYGGNYKSYMATMGRNLRSIGMIQQEDDKRKRTGEPLFPEITTYWARHTWATIAAGLDIPKETISEALGHEIGSSVTSIYIDFNRQKVDDANRKVIDYINSVGGWMRLNQIIGSIAGLFNDLR